MSNDAWERAVTRLRDDLTDAETRIVQLEEALRFYADERNYRMSRIHEKEGYLYPVQDQDRGKRARAALSREPSELPQGQKPPWEQPQRGPHFDPEVDA